MQMNREKLSVSQKHSATVFGKPKAKKGKKKEGKKHEALDQF